MNALLLVVFSVFFASAAASSLYCSDPNGNYVDYWTMFKFPKSATGSKGGLAYSYGDSNSPEPQIMEDDLSAVGNPFWKTLGKGNAGRSAWVYYNDETPEGKTVEDRAHAKGIIMVEASSQTGFWIVHSVPRFPARTSTGFPDDELTYGQSFLCLSITNSTNWADIATNLLISFPQVYDINTPSWLTSIAPDFARLQASSEPTDIPDTRYVQIGAGFLSFAKSNSWDSDLYSKLVAPTVQASLLVESWMRPAMDPVCDMQYTVNNVLEVNLNNIDFPETHDHSKWAVSTGGSSNIVCIGDINRMISQRKRGGGTVCWQTPQLWSFLSKAIVKKTSC